jgi:hypothetical protein
MFSSKPNEEFIESSYSSIFDIWQASHLKQHDSSKEYHFVNVQMDNNRDWESHYDSCIWHSFSIFFFDNINKILLKYK